MKTTLTFAVIGLLTCCFAGCGGDDDGNNEQAPPPGAPPPAAPAPTAGGTTPPPGGETTTPPTGGTTTPPNPNTPTTKTDFFASAPAYVATTGPSTIDRSGKGNGHLSFDAQGNPAGKACLDCHDGEGKKAPAFLFGGTVYTDATRTKVQPQVEVRLVSANNQVATTYTDTNGNFFIRAGQTNLAAPIRVGIRNAAGQRQMSNVINDGNCNQCHGTSAPIVL